jgi:hypothetical protein
MVFLIAYALFEVPSNYFLKKLRPSVSIDSCAKHFTPRYSRRLEMGCFLDARLGRIYHGLGRRTQLRTSHWDSFSTGRYGDVFSPSQPRSIVVRSLLIVL